MEDWKQRVIEEKKELGEKISKLVSFIHSDEFDGEDKGHIVLYMQLKQVIEYSETLSYRITKILT